MSRPKGSDYTSLPRIRLHEGANPNNASTAENIYHHLAVYGRSCNEELQALMDYDAEVNATDDISETLVTSHQDFVGGDINISGEYSRPTYLQEEDFRETLINLIDNGADVNATNSQNQSALMVACCQGNVNIINTFLDARADPTTADADGNTCLHYAVRGGCSKELFHTIIDHGADINAINKCNETALLLACWRKNADAMNVLLTFRADPNIGTLYGNAVLHIAVLNNINKDTLQAIIDNDVDVNAANKSGETALWIACHRDDVDAINVLLSAGANLNLLSAEGNTYLHCAVYGKKCCKEEVLQALIDHDADVNVTNKGNETALLVACKWGSPSAINVLLHAGADPNITDKNGNTCLIYATGNLFRQKELQSRTFLRPIGRKLILNPSKRLNKKRANSKIASLSRSISAICHHGRYCKSFGRYSESGKWSEELKEAECKEILLQLIDKGADVNATNSLKINLQSWWLTVRGM